VTDTVDIATRLEEWVSVHTNPVVNTFPDNPEDLDKTLPVVVCDIQRKRKVPSDQAFSSYEHQQHDLRIWVARLTILVKPEPSWEQTQLLYKYVDQLDIALGKDRTLGGRVKFASPEVDAEFPGEVEHPSGLVAIAAFFQSTVGETAEV
jgi:hypothetical protein